MSTRFHSYQPFPKPLPPVPAANQGPFCFTVDGKWIPYLLGAISILAVDQTWESDVYRASGEARNLLAEFAAATGCEIPDMAGTELGDCMGCCIRVFEGKIQTFNCGVWETIVGGDLTQLINGTSAPAQGAPQPGPGECEQFLGHVIYGGRWLLPVPVDSGDTFSVTNAFGATSGYIHDGLTYRCGDGLLFLAGGCVIGTEVFDAGNPLPAAPRDCLIAFDGTNYYDCSAAANGMSADFTIPPGISAANLVLLINNADVGGAGDLSFDLRICKGAASPLALTYTYGTGPAVANYGETVLLGVQDVGAGNWGCKFDLDRPAKMTILGQPGYVNTCSGAITFSNWFNPSGTLIGQLDYPAHSSLMDFTNGTVIQGWAGLTCTGGSAFNVQVRFDPL